MGDKEGWVIIKVKKTGRLNLLINDLEEFIPVDTGEPPNREYMWLKKSRLLEGTWRYGKLDKGDNILVVSQDRSLSLYEIKSEELGGHYIILDPPAVEAPPVPDWEEKMRETLFKNGWSAKDTQDFMDALYEGRHLWRKEKEGGE